MAKQRRYHGPRCVLSLRLPRLLPVRTEPEVRLDVLRHYEAERYIQWLPPVGEDHVMVDPWLRRTHPRSCFPLAHREIRSGAFIRSIDDPEGAVDHGRPEGLAHLTQERAQGVALVSEEDVHVCARYSNQIRRIGKLHRRQRQVAGQAHRPQPASFRPFRFLVRINEPELQERGTERTDVAVQAETALTASLGGEEHIHFVACGGLGQRGDLLVRKPADPGADQRQRDDDDGDGMARPEHQPHPDHARGGNRVLFPHPASRFGSTPGNPTR